MTQRCLYELVTGDGASISPFVWRIKYALAAKRIEYDSCGLGFTEIAQIDAGRFATVPILRDGEAYIGDSWAIADYLEGTYPEHPLFSFLAERAMVRFFDEWIGNSIRPVLFRICVMDIYNRIRPADRSYFRESREQRLGQTLEAVAADRQNLIPGFRADLQPMLHTLEKTPFLGGSNPNYADFIALGTFIWAGSVATVELLTAADPLLDWLRRGLGLFGGIGRALSLPALHIES